MTKSAILLATSTLTIVVQSTSAYACSLPSCQPGDTFPTTGNVPANALAWFVKASTFSELGDAGSAQDGIRVFVASNDGGEQETELELTVEVPSPAWPEGAEQVWVPASEVPVGSLLRVESSLGCSQPIAPSELTVTEPAPIPTSLGTLAVTTANAPLLLWTNSAGCVEPVPSVFADVEVLLSTDALPFADVLRYSLLVDGEHYRATDFIEYEDDFDTLRGGVLRRRIAGSEYGPGKDRAFATCGPDLWPMQGVEPKRHELQMAALMPDGTLITSDVVSVDLTCPPCGADAGPDCTESNGSDAGTLSTSAETPDASVSQPTDPSETESNAAASSAEAPDSSLSQHTHHSEPDSDALTTTGVASPAANTLETDTSTSNPTSTITVTQSPDVDTSAPPRDDPDVDDEAKDLDASIPDNTKPNDDAPTSSIETPVIEVVTTPSETDGGADAGLEMPSAPHVKKRDSGCSTAPTTPRSASFALLASLLGLALGTRRSRRAMTAR